MMSMKKGKGSSAGSRGDVYQRVHSSWSTVPLKRMAFLAFRMHQAGIAAGEAAAAAATAQQSRRPTGKSKRFEDWGSVHAARCEEYDTSQGWLIAER